MKTFILHFDLIFVNDNSSNAYNEDFLNFILSKDLNFEILSLIPKDKDLSEINEKILKATDTEISFYQTDLTSTFLIKAAKFSQVKDLLESIENIYSTLSYLQSLTEQKNLVTATFELLKNSAFLKKLANVTTEILKITNNLKEGQSFDFLKALKAISDYKKLELKGKLLRNIITQITPSLKNEDLFNSTQISIFKDTCLLLTQFEIVRSEIVSVIKNFTLIKNVIKAPVFKSLVEEKFLSISEQCLCDYLSEFDYMICVRNAILSYFGYEISFKKEEVTLENKFSKFLVLNESNDEFLHKCTLLKNLISQIIHTHNESEKYIQTDLLIKEIDDEPELEPEHEREHEPEHEKKSDRQNYLTEIPGNESKVSKPNFLTLSLKNSIELSKMKVVNFRDKCAKIKQKSKNFKPEFKTCSKYCTCPFHLNLKDKLEAKSEIECKAKENNFNSINSINKNPELIQTSLTVIENNKQNAVLVENLKKLKDKHKNTTKK